jgi:outer membrane cobalamin receptor
MRTPCPIAASPARTLCAASLAAALMGLSGMAGAAAQRPGDLSELSLEELANVDVSAASLLSAGLLDTAASVSAVTPQQWQRRGARRLLDALETQPGVLVLPHTSGNQVLAIRGYARSTSYTGVATSWDGVPLNDLFRSAPQFNLPAINLGALSQLQLIEGPGSALYGSDAFHGMVALRGYESDRDQRNVSATGASNGYYEAALQQSAALGAGTRLNVALAANGQPDQERVAYAVHPLTGRPLHSERENNFQAQTASFKLAGEGQGGLSWFGGLYLHHDDADAFQGSGTRLSGGDDLGWLATRFAMTQAGVRRELAQGGSVELKGYYWWVDNDLASNLGTGAVPIHRDLWTRQFRTGLQATWRDGVPAWHTAWALSAGQERLGVRSARAEAVTMRGLALPTTVNPAEGAGRGVRNLTLELNSNWGQRWSLVYGGRLDDYTDFGRHGSPRLGLIYHPQPDTALKLLYGQAFRAPSAVEKGGAAGSVLGNPELKPEVIDSYELVAQRQTARYLAQFTLFRTLWRDGISAVLAPPATLTQYRNVGSNDAYGATTSLRAQWQGWEVDASASYVRSRNAVTGADYNIFPSTMVNVSLSHTLADPACLLTLSQRWQSRTDDMPSTEGLPVHTLPRYLRTDVGVERRYSPRLTANLQLRNLFNRDNRLPSPPASVGGIPDEHLSLNLRLDYRY